MTEIEALESVKDAIVNTMDFSRIKIGRNTDLREEIGADSLDMSEIALFLEERHNIDDIDITEAKIVQDLVDKLMELSNGNS